MPGSRNYYGAAEHCDQMFWGRGPVLLAGPGAVRVWGTAQPSWPCSSTAEPHHNTRAVIRAENSWAQGGQQLGTHFCAAQLPALGGLVLLLLAAAGSQRFSRCSAVHKLGWGLVTLSVRCFSEYTVIFSLCVCIHMNMMVCFHYNKKFFPKYFLYNIHVETMSLTWRRCPSHEHLCV